MKINLIANLNKVLIGLSFEGEREITVGREMGNTIAPLAADGLSRHHAKIYFKDGQWYVEDLGSTNGSYCKGQKIEGPTVLKPRDMLQFGKFEISVDEMTFEPMATSAAPAVATPAFVQPVAAACSGSRACSSPGSRARSGSKARACSGPGACARSGSKAHACSGSRACSSPGSRARSSSKARACSGSEACTSSCRRAARCRSRRSRGGPDRHAYRDYPCCKARVRRGSGHQARLAAGGHHSANSRCRGISRGGRGAARRHSVAYRPAASDDSGNVRERIQTRAQAAGEACVRRGDQDAGEEDARPRA